MAVCDIDDIVTSLAITQAVQCPPGEAGAACKRALSELAVRLNKALADCKAGRRVDGAVAADAARRLKEVVAVASRSGFDARAFKARFAAALARLSDEHVPALRPGGGMSDLGAVDVSAARNAFYVVAAAALAVAGLTLWNRSATA